MPEGPTAPALTRLAIRTLTLQPAPATTRLTRLAIRVITNVETTLATPRMTRLAIRTLSASTLPADVVLTTVAYATVTRPMRKMRRTGPMTVEEAWTIVSSLQVDAETGIGTPSGDGEVPTITLRWSKDHGHTWSQGLTIELGRAGDYTHRLLWRKLGRARDWQFEVVCDAPVPLTLLGAFANTGAKSTV